MKKEKSKKKSESVRDEKTSPKGEIGSPSRRKGQQWVTIKQEGKKKKRLPGAIHRGESVCQYDSLRRGAPVEDFRSSKSETTYEPF